MSSMHHNGRLKLYPVKLKPVLKEYIWGERNLEKFGIILPEGNTAEVWEASFDPDGISIISNGMYKGMRLVDYISMMGKEAIGANLNNSDIFYFPLLLKLIDPKPGARNIYNEIPGNDKYFSLELYSAAGEIKELADGSKFFIYLFLEGNAMLNYTRGRLPVTAGESIFIPASMGAFTLKGDFKALKLYVPDIQLDMIALGSTQILVKNEIVR